MKGTKTGGRKRGTPNKLTGDAREAIRLAAEGAGGVPALTQWAKRNPDKFWPLYARLIPSGAVSVNPTLPSAIRIELVSQQLTLGESLGRSHGSAECQGCAVADSP